MMPLETLARRRVGHLAQVGLDFGTAFSKCVVRDLASGRAHVVEGPENQVRFLFPSIIRFAGKRIMPGAIGGGRVLPFSKMMMVAASRQKSYGTIGTAWGQFLKGLSPNEVLENVVMVTGAFLASILFEARSLAARMMPGFGGQDDDVLLVNLCVPVDDMQDERTVTAFRQALKLAWVLSEGEAPSRGYELAFLRQRSKEISNKDAEYCELYPEVAANVQAFLKSGFAREMWGVPFFMSDIGAGTVDQSYFLLSPSRRRLTFLAGVVEHLGSSEIERRCASLLNENGLTVTQEIISQIREHKERNAKLPAEMGTVFNSVLKQLKSGVTQMTGGSVQSGLKLLPHDARNVERQFGKTILFFAGGGVRDHPYRRGVEEAFRSRWGFSPERVELPRPNDLVRASGERVPDDWFRRLTVAYGLSFDVSELHEIKLPNQNKPPNASSSKDPRGSTLKGRCVSCGRPAIVGDDYCYRCR